MILITGATGFIGSSLIKSLPEDQPIRILARNPGQARKMFPRAEVVKGDLFDKYSLKKATRRADTIIHLAGLVSYRTPKAELMRVNCEGTKNLLEMCRSADRFIFASSVAVMGEIKTKTAAGENYKGEPENDYGASKLEAEKAVAKISDEINAQYIILRIAPVYGESAFWQKNLKLLEKGFPIPKTQKLTHIVHISDVVQAFQLAMKTSKTGIYIIADKEPVKFTDLAEKLITLLGHKPKKYPFWLVRLIASASGMGPYFNTLTINRNYDITRAMNYLGYRPKADLDTELKKMVEWYKNQVKV
jgi:nucleoside-diphosphate-sugar epimerase